MTVTADTCVPMTQDVIGNFGGSEYSSAIFLSPENFLNLNLKKYFFARIKQANESDKKFQSSYDSNPANTGRQNNVASTSLRRHGVAATSKRRYYYALCLLRIWFVGMHTRSNIGFNGTRFSKIQERSQ